MTLNLKTWHYALIAFIIVVVIAVVLFKDKIWPKKATTPTAPAAQPPVQYAPQNTLDLDMMLMEGSKGEEVKYLQQLLGVAADGIFGPITKAALQNRKGVTQTTLAGFASLPDLGEDWSGGSATAEDEGFIDTIGDWWNNIWSDETPDMLIVGGTNEGISWQS